MRDAVVVGGLLLRRGSPVTRALGVAVGALAAAAVSGVLGLAAFLGHVDERGTARGFGPEDPRGCVQAANLFSPLGREQYSGELLAATCGDPPVPPGLPHFPRPGEVFLSPALTQARASEPGLRLRYPQVTGLIGPSGLVSSNEYFVVVGMAPQPEPLPTRYLTFATFGSPSSYLDSYLRFGRPVLLVLGLFFTLAPTAFLVTACTRLNARTRQGQLTILGRIGVPPAALRSALVIETTVTVGVGAAIGMLLARSAAGQATPTFVAWRAFPGDLALTWTATASGLLVLLLTVAGSAVAGSRAATVAGPATARAGSR